LLPIYLWFLAIDWTKPPTIEYWCVFQPLYISQFNYKEKSRVSVLGAKTNNS
jgi:hypothetical protein